MYVLSARAFRVSTFLATGRWPKTSPPVTVETIRPAELESHRVLYFCLHGWEGDPVPYGDDEVPAISAGLVAQADLTGAIVYMAGCWGVGPVSEAMLDAGAAAVVADQDVNWSGYFLPKGSNALGRLFLRGLRLGAD